MASIRRGKDRRFFSGPTSPTASVACTSHVTEDPEPGPEEIVYLMDGAKAFGTSPHTFRRDLIDTGLIPSVESGRLRIIRALDLYRALRNPDLKRFYWKRPKGYSSLVALGKQIGMYLDVIKRVAKENGIDALFWGRDWIRDDEREALVIARQLFPPARRFRTIDRFTAGRIIGSAKALEEHLVHKELEPATPANTGDRFDLFSVVLLRIRRERGIVPKRDEKASTKHAISDAMLAEYIGKSISEIPPVKVTVPVPTVSICDAADKFGMTPAQFRKDLIDSGLIASEAKGRGARIKVSDLRRAMKEETCQKFIRVPPHGYRALHLIGQEHGIETENLRVLCSKHGISTLRWGLTFILKKEGAALEKALGLLTVGARLRTISEEAAARLVGSPELLASHVSEGRLPAPSDTAIGPRYNLLSVAFLRMRMETGAVSRPESLFVADLSEAKKFIKRLAKDGDKNLPPRRTTITLSEAAAILKVESKSVRRRYINSGKLVPARPGLRPLLYEEDVRALIDDARLVSRKAPDEARYVSVHSVARDSNIGPRKIARIALENNLDIVVQARSWLARSEAPAFIKAASYFPSQRFRSVDRYTAARLIGSETALNMHLVAKHTAPPDSSLRGERFDLFSVILLRIRREQGLVEAFDRDEATKQAYPIESVAALVQMRKPRIAPPGSVSLYTAAERFGRGLAIFKRLLIKPGRIKTVEVDSEVRILNTELEAALNNPRFEKYNRTILPNTVPVSTVAKALGINTPSLKNFCLAHAIEFSSRAVPTLRFEDRDLLIGALNGLNKAAWARTIDDNTAALLIGSRNGLALHAKEQHVPRPKKTMRGLSHRLASILLLRERRRRLLVERLGDPLEKPVELSAEEVRSITMGDTSVYNRYFPPQKYVSLRAAAKRMGLSTRAFRKRVLIPRRIPHVSKGTRVTLLESNLDKLLADPSALAVRRSAPEGYVELNLAARSIGISVSTLKAVAEETGIELQLGDRICWFPEREVAPLMATASELRDSWNRTVDIAEAGKIVGSRCIIGLHEAAGHIRPTPAKAEYRVKLWSVLLLKHRRKAKILPQLEQGKRSLKLTRGEARELLGYGEYVFGMMVKNGYFSDTGDLQFPFWKAEIEHQAAEDARS